MAPRTADAVISTAFSNTAQSSSRAISVEPPVVGSAKATRPDATRWASCLLVGPKAGQRLPDHERMDLGRALVRQHRLEVVHVADHRILERDAARAQDRARLARDLERLADVVQLAHADLLRQQPALVLHAPEV